MIIAVVQSCDWCGKQEKAAGMHVPEGWIICDLRGGKDPGVQGYGWNICDQTCLLELIQDWAAGKHPLPHGMSEQSQVIKTHEHPPPPPVQRRRPEEVDADMIAQASAEYVSRRGQRIVPEEEQGLGGH